MEARRSEGPRSPALSSPSPPQRMALNTLNVYPMIQLPNTTLDASFVCSAWCRGGGGGAKGTLDCLSWDVGCPGDFSDADASFFFFFNLFIYFWPHRVFVAARGLSLVAASRGYSSVWCAGFSLRWLLLLRSTGSRRAGFSRCGSRTLQHRLSSCGARA